MTSKMLLELSKLFQKCPRCKSEKLDGDSGSLDISSGLIRRTCACGYSVSLIIEETSADSKAVKVPEEIKFPTQTDSSQNKTILLEQQQKPINYIEGQMTLVNNEDSGSITIS